MWIGAHPDDEVLVAPLLAHWCVDAHARCTLLTATRGEAGACLLPGGCLPDLASVRSAEAGASSQFFGATLILLSLPDGGGAAPPPWAPGYGGFTGLPATIAALIRAEAPQLVLTFDPRHGTTCHPDHRAIAAVVLEAVGLLDAPPAIQLLETRLDVEAQPFALHLSSASPVAIRFDANTRRTVGGDPAWSALATDMKRYPSQFDAAWLAAGSQVPAVERSVWVAPASTALGTPASACP
jgi:LmbE family N-acetylglucosaminyl deacetylase